MWYAIVYNNEERTMNAYIAVTHGLVLFLALIFSGWFIGQCIILFVKGIRRTNYELPLGNVIIPSFLWAVFYVMKVLQ